MNNVVIKQPKVDIIDFFSDVPNYKSDCNISKIIEYVGRVCYQTQDKITPESFERFVIHAAKMKHRSIFEFNNLQFIINNKIFKDELDEISSKMAFYYNNFITLKNISSSSFILTGSIRAFLEFFEDFISGDLCSECNKLLITTLFNILHKEYPYIINNWCDFGVIFDVSDYVNVKFRNITHEFYNNDDTTKILVKVITSRGVHNEFVRHRMTRKKGGVSYMAESQRYVRYGEKKPFSIIIPSSLKDSVQYYNALINNAKESFNEYKSLLKLGFSPSLASAVLPRSTAIEYFIYTTIDEWRHIFRLRTSSYAHIEFQEVAKAIRAKMINKGVYI